MAWFNYPKQLTFNVLTFTELFLIVLCLTFITIGQTFGSPMLQGCIYLLRNSKNILYSKHTHLSLLSMATAQMFLQRRSRPRVACWMDSQSVSVAQASQSCSSTSHRFSTDATPVLCFSMSRCRSCRDRRFVLSFSRHLTSRSFRQFLFHFSLLGRGACSHAFLHKLCCCIIRSKIIKKLSLFTII